MANIMSLKTIMNKPSRNGFDLSSKRNFTAKAGELLPVWSSPVIPGDVYSIDLKAIARTQPVNTAAFARIREYYDFYYVPYHLLWNRANEVLSQIDSNQQHSTGFGKIPSPFTGELPYVTASQIGAYIRTMAGLSSNGVENNFFGYKRANLSVKLLEYLGYGNYDTFLQTGTSTLQYNPEMNVFALLAYQKIYSDYYRFQQWEKPNPSTFNCDYMSGSTSMNLPVDGDPDTDFYQNYNFFDLRYCNWPKDLYHGLVPSAQFGDTAVVPLDSDFNGNFTAYLDANGIQDAMLVSTGADDRNRSSITFPSAPVQGANSVSSTSLVGISIRPDTVTSVPDKGKINFINTSGLSVGGLSILALRQYEFLQKWKEIAQCGDQDYKGMTKRMWNVDIANELSDRCQYLGGIASSMDINEVVNTNITDQFGADIAGKGYGQSSGKIDFKSDGQYGVIMCIYHAMPLVDYTVDYISPENTRVNAEDFANPVFDRVGMQPVSSLPIMQTPVSASSGLTPLNLGYAPRYIDYKTSIDLSFGAFKRDLQAWVVSYGYSDIAQSIQSTSDDEMNPDTSSQSPLSYPFFKVNPNMLDPIFAVAVDSDMSTDQFLCSSFFDVKVVRNLDVDGLPY